MGQKIKIRRGTVIRSEPRWLVLFKFDHFGIYAGNKRVIHFRAGKIRRESIDKFVDNTSWFFDDEFDVMGFKPEFIKDITLEMSYQRACQFVGYTGYDVFENNCEHFALWCRTGNAYSGQAFGSVSEEFSKWSGSFGNITRIISFFNNELGMQKSRTVLVKSL